MEMEGDKDRFRSGKETIDANVIIYHCAGIDEKPNNVISEVPMCERV